MTAKTENWVVFRSISEAASSQALVEFLNSKGVPARVEAPNLVPGVEGYFLVCVPEQWIHRARFFAPESSFEESELDYLATGKLGNDEMK
jgi:hypothetical protein